MHWNLEGGVAVITGAASGIGRALAKRLAREKMSLALVDVDANGLEQTVSQLGITRENISTHVADVADAAAIERLATQVIEHHAHVTLLVNNAGVAVLGTFEEISLEEFNWLMRINFWGVVHGVKCFLPLLRREPRAHIANVSSALGLVASAGNVAYCASKFAVRGFTEALQHELNGTNVRVSCVLPGKIRTQFSLRQRISAGAIRSSDIDRYGVHRLGLTSPAAAADRMVEGIIRGERRILIGPDAIWFERLQRVFPARYEQALRSLRIIRGLIGTHSAARPEQKDASDAQ
ncbi:MAG TPA: SDR family oxidoreductase [Candidatus Acidoferrum sp.]|nr:SDR family oxidoreductase [Candidatus Acidoferrum sp.]